MRLAILPVLLAALAAPAAAAVPTASPPQGTLAAMGYALYGQYCIACHGSAGAGILKPVRAGGGPLREQKRTVGALDGGRTNLHRELRARCSTPSPSRTTSNRSRAGSRNRSTAPLGQRTSMDAADFSAPRPKWTRRSLEDMNPTLAVT